MRGAPAPAPAAHRQRPDLVRHGVKAPSPVLAEPVNSLRSVACFMRSWDA